MSKSRSESDVINVFMPTITPTLAGHGLATLKYKYCMLINGKYRKSRQEISGSVSKCHMIELSRLKNLNVKIGDKYS